jgi:hypothetical protein
MGCPLPQPFDHVNRIEVLEQWLEEGVSDENVEHIYSEPTWNKPALLEVKIHHKCDKRGVEYLGDHKSDGHS